LKFGQSERARYREAKAAAKVEEITSLLTEFAEANQVSAQAASLNAAVTTKCIKLYSSSTTSHTFLPAPVSTGKIVTPPRTHPSRTETQGETNSFSEEQEQEQETFFRENTPASDVISFGSEEEEQVRDTPYSPVQSTSPSPVLPPTSPSAQPDDYYFLGAGILEQRISEQQSRSTSAISQSSNPPHTYIPQGPSRQYDSYRPQNRYRSRGRNHRHQPRLYRRE
jgi:hypothetical protein